MVCLNCKSWGMHSHRLKQSRINSCTLLLSGTEADQRLTVTDRVWKQTQSATSRSSRQSKDAIWKLFVCVACRHMREWLSDCEAILFDSLPAMQREQVVPSAGRLVSLMSCVHKPQSTPQKYSCSFSNIELVCGCKIVRSCDCFEWITVSNIQETR